MLVAFGVALLLTIALSLYLSFTFTGRAVRRRTRPDRIGLMVPIRCA